MQTRVLSLALLLALGGLALAPTSLRPALADGVPVPAPASHDPVVEAAIGKVWPALVQIHVLTVAHEGGRERKYEAAGSGAIITPDGYVVTNHHVAGRAASVWCVLSTREEVPATLVGTDVLSDLAVLKLDLSARPKDAQPLKPAVFGSSAALKIGDPVLAMGCPLALSHSVTRGIVANKDLMMSKFGGGSFMLDGEDVGSLVKWIGHDATIQPGNSGGPLVSLAGEIIGVNEIGVGTMSGAIPSDIARKVVDEIIAKGRVTRAWTGAEFQPLLKSQADVSGVLVAGVIEASPAERCGLQAGDIVTAIDGEAVHARFREELPAFTSLLLSKELGRPIALDILRSGQKRSIKLEAEARDDVEGKEVESRDWGLSVREVTTPVAKELRRKDKSGVLVGSSRNGGPADQAQPSINPGDVIVEVAGKPVTDLARFQAISAEITAGAAGPVPTLVAFERRGGRYLTLVEVGVRAPQPPTPENKKAWFPASTQVLSKKLATALGLKGKKGVRLVEVYPESTAEAAGFKAGDVLTHLDGQPIDASEPQDGRVFDELIRQYKLDSKVVVTVHRGGEKLEIAITLGAAPSAERELATHEDTTLELKARDVSYFDKVERRWPMSQTGAIITQVEAGGWAAVSGLRSGDLVLAVDGNPVTGAKDLATYWKAIGEKKAKRTAILVRRGIHTMFFEVEPT